MKKALFKFFIVICTVAVSALAICFAGCKGKNFKLITVEMSDKTRNTIVSTIGFDNVYYLQERGWNEITYPDLLKRGTGYVAMPTKDDGGNPLPLKTDYDDTFCEMDYVSSFTPKSGYYDKVMLYLHGGAYISPATSGHTLYCDNLSAQNNALVIAPNYGLTPQCNYTEAYVMLDAVYSEILKLNKPVIILGDSAGGGLAVSYTMDLKARSKKIPDKVVLLSPWLDVTMTNPEIPSYQTNERILAPYGLIEAGKLWANGFDTSNYKISPINGDFTDFPETLLFRATWEIFYPDEVKLENILKSKNVKLTVAELKGFIHAAPVMYYLQEYEQMLQIVADFVK